MVLNCRQQFVLRAALSEVQLIRKVCEVRVRIVSGDSFGLYGQLGYTSTHNRPWNVIFTPWADFPGFGEG